MAEIDYSRIPVKDLEILATGTYEGVSIPTLQYISGEGGSSWDAFTSNAGRGFTSSLRGLGILQPDEEADIQAEKESRMLLETNPLAGWAGLLIGSALDPVTLPAAILKPLAIGGKVVTGALRGAAGGAFGGAIDPVYEEMGDSRVMNVMGGTVLGGALGGLVGKFFGKSGTEVASKAEGDAAKILDSEDPAKAIDDLATEDVAKVAIPESAVFNKETGTFEVFNEETPVVDFNLPRTLTGAKPRFNQFNTTFSNDVDKAFYVVGNTSSKSKSHAAYVDWLMDATGLDEAGVIAAAKTARKELVKSFGKSTPDAQGRLAAEPSSIAQSIIQQRSAPRQVAKPLKPTVTVKDGLDEADLSLLQKAGVNVNVGRNGTLIVQDLFASNKVMTNAEFLRRMEAAGIGIDLPAYRQRTRASVKEAQAVEREQMMSPEFWTKQPAPAPERAPVFDKQSWSAAQPMSPQTKAAWTTPPGATRPVDELATGAPRDSSMGAASTRPSTLYGEALTPKELKPIPKIELANRAMSMSLEDFVKLVPRREMEQLRKEFPDDVALERYLKEGQEKLKNILKNNNNIVEWMVKKSKSPNPLSKEEVGAFAPFYYRAMAAREGVLQKALEHRRAGGSFESAEGAQLVEDLMYYTGIALFKKEAGSKAGRALNAFNLFSQKNATGQRLKNMFPGVAC